MTKKHIVKKYRKTSLKVYQGVNKKLLFFCFFFFLMLALLQVIKMCNMCFFSSFEINTDFHQIYSLSFRNDLGLTRPKSYSGKEHLFSVFEKTVISHVEKVV